MKKSLLLLIITCFSFISHARTIQCFETEGLTPGQKSTCIRPLLDKLCRHAGLQSCRENAIQNVIRYRIVERAYLEGQFDINNPEDVDAMVDFLKEHTTTSMEQSTYDDAYVNLIKAQIEKQRRLNERNAKNKP